MAGVPTAPDADDVRALARSSPWRWRSVRFTTHAIGRGSSEAVRAWIERPNRIRVERLTGEVLLDEVQEVGPSIGFAVAYSEADLEDDPRLAEPVHRAAVTADLRRESEAR